MKNSVGRAVSWLAIAALLGAASIGSLAQPASAQETSGGGSYAPVVASSVRVLALSADGRAAYGTGWVIQAADDKNRAGASVVVTARHVIAGAVKVMIVESGAAIGDQKPATVISVKADQDIAFLEVKNLAKPALQLTRSRPNIGDSIAAAGYTTASDRGETDGRAHSATLKRGGLSKYFLGPVGSEAQAPIDQIEFDAPILAGFSGGPLLNQCGRVIGMTVKDGGHIQIAEGASVAMAQGVATAVASDEIIRAARAASVEVDVVDAACGSAETTKLPPPPPLKACPGPYMSVDAAEKPCLPVEPNGLQRAARMMKSPVGLLIGIALLGFLITMGTFVWIMRRRARPTASQVFGSGEDMSKYSGPGSSLLDQGGSRLRGAQTLRLTGRGVDGGSIDLVFTADELRTAPVMLGVEGSANGRIADNRSKTLVSRRHAQIAYDGQNFTIEDNKSLNGTKVGTAKLEPFTKRTVVSGDTISLADVALHVNIG